MIAYDLSIKYNQSVMQCNIPLMHSLFTSGLTTPVYTSSR